jgi:uncharacterized protein (TIGR00725 family)
MGKATTFIITVFGSSRSQPGSQAYETAQALGATLAKSSFVVANGGYGGTMEATARGARKAGGTTIGVTAEAFRSKANPWIEKEIRVQDWQARLFKLIELGTGYVALPGGTGTLVELSVVWEWINKRFIEPRPLVLLGDYWLPVVNAIPKAELHSNPILPAATPEEAASFLTQRLL